MKLTIVGDTTYVEMTTDECVELEEKGRTEYKINIDLDEIKTRYVKLGTPPKPDIEVGDVVKGAHYACGIGEGKVLSIYLGKAHVESSHELVSLDRLTLISKGAKKIVMKGMREIVLRTHCDIDDSIGGAQEDRTYTLTLEETE